MPYSSVAFRNQEPPGFSLIEVLVSLMVSGILMAMISMVMGQVVQNDEALRGLVGKTAEAATLRRILHRDLSSVQGPLKLDPAGFSFPSTHNHLLAGPLPVTVTWTFREGIIRRLESAPDIRYASEIIFARNLRDWQMEFHDLNGNVWINGKSGAALGPANLISGLRLTLLFADQSQLKILERIPYATSF